MASTYELIVKAVDETRGPLNSIDRNLKSLDKSASKVQNTLRGVGAALLATVTSGALRNLVALGSRYQDLTSTLNVLTGSAEKGAAAFREIQQQATKTQFGVDELAQTYIKLAGAGIRPTERLIRTFTDAAAISTDQVGSLNAITDLFSRNMQGGLGLEDLNRLADRGIPVFDILADKLNINRLQVGKLGQTAEGAQKILAALGDGINERFGGATEKRLQNTSTLMSNFGLAVKSAAASIFTEMQPALDNALRTSTEWLTVNESLAKTIGVGLGDAITVTARAMSLVADNIDLIRNAFITFLAIRGADAFITLAKRVSQFTVTAKSMVAFMGAAGKAVQSFASKIPLVGVALTGLVRIMSVAGPALLNPFVAIPAVIAAAVTGGLYYFRDSMITVGNTSASVGETVRAAFQLVGGYLRGVGSQILSDFGLVWDKVVEFSVTARNAFGTAFQAISRFSSGATNFIINGFVVLYQYVLGFTQNMSLWFAAAFSSIGRLADNMVQVVTARFAKLGEALQLALSGDIRGAMAKAGESTGKTFTAGVADAFKGLPGLIPKVDVAGIMSTDRVGQAADFVKEKFNSMTAGIQGALERQILLNRGNAEGLSDVAREAAAAAGATQQYVDAWENLSGPSATGGEADKEKKAELNALQQLITNLRQATVDLGLYEHAQQNVSILSKQLGIDQNILSAALDSAATSARGGQQSLDEYYRSILSGAKAESQQLAQNQLLRSRFNADLETGVVTAREYKEIMERLFPPATLTAGERILETLKGQKQEVSELTESLKNYSALARAAGVDEEEFRRQQQDRLQSLGVDSRTLSQTILDNFHKAGEGLSRSLAEAVTKGGNAFKSLKDIVNRVLDDILIAIVQKNITAPLVQQITGFASSLGGGGSGGFDMGSLIKMGASFLGGGGGMNGSVFDLFSGPFPGAANGGIIPGNKPTLVGERGPELFMPNTTGSIVPREQLNTGGGETIVNFNINAVDTQTGVEFLLKNKPSIIGMITQAQNQRGRQGITS